MNALLNLKPRQHETANAYGCKIQLAVFHEKKKQVSIVSLTTSSPVSWTIAGNRRARKVLWEEPKKGPSLRPLGFVISFKLPMESIRRHARGTRRSRSASSRQYPCPHGCVEILTINDDVDQSVTIAGEKYNTFFEHHVNYNK